MGRIVRVISKDASVVCSAIDGKDIVSRIEEIHKTSAVVTAALGRLAMGTSLMGFGLKGKDDSITVKMELPLNDKGKLDVRGAVGSNGTLSVVKDMGLKEPYCGQVPIVSGEIAEDITNYLAVSEQVPSVCALGVLVNPDLTVNCAGGFLIQLLPFAPESAIDQIEKNINGMESVTKLICGGMTTEAIAMKALEGLEPNVLDDFEVNYRCDCSRERVENALISLGRAELEDLSKDGGTDVECHFCDKKYHFTPEEILGLIKE